MIYLSRLLRFSLVMVALVAVTAGSLVLVAPQVAKLVGAHRSDHERLSLEPLAERSYIIDSQGNVQGTLINAENENRVPVKVEDVPETVTGAILAAEDENFYLHKGVNLRSIGRAVDANLDSGSASQGGSTITQQVVKNSLVGDDQDLSRKIREAFLAVELEKQMGKDEILERYINSVYFGGGAYGVQAASEYYFDKNVADLNFAEGALLASLIRSPSTYDPFKNPELSAERRSIVFDRLLETGRATEDEIAVYETVPLPTVPNVPLPPDDYFVEEVKQRLLDDPRYGLGATPAARNKTVFESGIRVYTTFDPRMQLSAVAARNETIPNNQGDGTFPVTIPATGEQTFGTQALASVEPSTGAIRAMVGGPGFETYQFNLATSLPGRQPGSSMKTFVLAALFENGYVPSDTVSGGSCLFDVPGQSETYSVSGKGSTNTIAAQTRASNNCAFLRLGQVVGTDKVVDMAKRLGVRSPLESFVSLPLGSFEISPIDMASAYATFANDGIRNEPYYIDRIEDKDGKVLYQHQLEPVRVLDEEVARMVNATLASNVESGTGTRARISGGQVAAGKTGTTNASSDVWFVGYTPQLSTAIWMGVPLTNISLSNAGLGGATGGRYPASTWGSYYSKLYESQPNVPFIAPEGTRSGKSVGKVPNEISRSGGSSDSDGGGTGTGTRPGTVPNTPTIDFGD